MARSISADALAIIASGARYDTRCTVTHPDVDPVTVNIAPGWSVPEKGSTTGPRLSVSSLQLLASDGIDDLFAFAGYPGAVYDLHIGVIMGASTEWLQVFSGYVVEGSSKRNAEGVTVSLADGWSWSDQVSLVEPFVTHVNVSRAATIVDLLTPPAVGFATEVSDVGGYINTSGVYTDSRGQAAAAIAADGLVQAGFDGTGTLVIKTRPDLDAGARTADWLFRSGQSVSLAVPAEPAYPATVVAGSLERSRAWADSLFNAVTVKPGGTEQKWAAQTAYLTNEADPRHESRIGLRPLEVISDTIGNACDALLLAEAELNRQLRRSNETVKVQVLLNPAIEADDVFWVGALPTLDDSGWNGAYIATSVTHSPKDATTTVEGVSVDVQGSPDDGIAPTSNRIPGPGPGPDPADTAGYGLGPYGLDPYGL